MKMVYAAAVGCNGSIRLMASMVLGLSLSPMVNGIAAEPGPHVDLSVSARGADDHEAGSGRPVTTEAKDMRCYQQQHRFYTGIERLARTLFTHRLDQQGRTILCGEGGRTS
jgi:hypothetical protein